MVKIYYFISACLLLFTCNNSNTQVSSFDDTSKLIKNISLTMAGEKVLQEDFTKEKRDNIKEYYNNDLLNKILS